MITLNLMPRERKLALKNTRLFFALKEAATLIFLFASIGAIMLWVSRYYLEQQLSDLVVANAVNIKSNEATNAKIVSINAKIKTVENIQNNFLPLGQLTGQLSLLVPENIALDSIRFYRQQATVELSGTAKTRNDLLSFKNILEQTPWINKTDLPLIDLIEKTDNKFTVKLEVDASKLSPRL
jgi:Tfp pilus assembly protein PilN